VIGARLGYVILYRFNYYWNTPFEIIAMWKGGMSFHGGLVGIVIVVLFYTKKHRVNVLSFADVGCANVPISILVARIANFINGELYGTPTDVWWAIPFPKGGGVPRHPSQLYEGLLEGLLLFIVLRIAYKYVFQKRGVVMSLFFVGYGCARFVSEYFREPENLSWFESSVLSGGQILSLPMIFIGSGLFIFFYTKPNKTAT
jgi:phosphatidylglycerol---prolipoprotein diacylglyceryl transferase